MNNAGIVIACFAYLIGSSSLFNLLANEFDPTAAVGTVSIPAGIPNQSNGTFQGINDPANPCNQNTAIGRSTNENCFGTAFRYGLDCTLNIFTLTLLGSCDFNTRSQTFTVISSILDFVSAAFLFLFQWIQGKIPFLPQWLVFIVIGPPGAGLGFIAFQTIASRSS